VHVADDDMLMPVAARVLARPDALAGSLAAVAAAVAQLTGKSVGGAAGDAIGDPERAVAKSLVGKERSAIFLGHYAQQHPDFAILFAIAQEIGRITGATVGILPDGANAVGGHLAGALPTHGLDARAMIEQPRAAYLIAGVEPELDMGPAAAAAIARARFTVVLCAYRSAATEAAHVVLPITPFTETAGTFVNMEGRVQAFNAAVKPCGDSRPGWKVLRMLGAMLEVPDFHVETIEAVRGLIAPDLQAWATRGLGNSVAPFTWKLRTARAAIERIAEFGIYAGDPVVRRSLPLQKSADGKAARTARFSAATAARLGVQAGAQVRVRQEGGGAVLAVAIDAALPDGTVRIARGVAETAALGEGEIEIERVGVAAVA
jgi:NADH-quinone oxidoreductase subunit G